MLELFSLCEYKCYLVYQKEITNFPFLYWERTQTVQEHINFWADYEKSGDPDDIAF